MKHLEGPIYACYGGESRVGETCEVEDEDPGKERKEGLILI